MSGQARRARGQAKTGARLSRAAKLRGRRGRKAAEEAAGQAAAVVNHDAPASDAGLVQGHGPYIARDFGSAICVGAFRHSGAVRSIEPGISRFRVWSFEPSRNDEAVFDCVARNDGNKKSAEQSPALFRRNGPEENYSLTAAARSCL